MLRSEKNRACVIKKEIYTKNAPEPVGPYSQAVKFNDLVFVSGQIPVHPDTGVLCRGPIDEQTTLTLNNISAILFEAGSSLQNVIKVEVYLKNMVDFNKVNEVYNKIFTCPIKPARVVVEVNRLPKDVEVEIACIAGLDCAAFEGI